MTPQQVEQYLREQIDRAKEAHAAYVSAHPEAVAPEQADECPKVVATGGVSLRDWFAGQALAGSLASYAGFVNHPDPHKAASRAYEYADAMLAEREKGGSV